ncbi:MAG: MlaD family protein [Methylomonas sp.]|jgi:paraquat-inducible protein B
MSENKQAIDISSIPEARAQQPKHYKLPLVWIVPIVAAIIGGWIAVHAILARGPTITLMLIDAEGIEAGKTKVRYKSVDVGTVNTVTIALDHTVAVSIDMAKFSEPFLVEDTHFWVVRPRLGATGVSGLNTLFSGAYIGMDAGVSTHSARKFIGLEAPPVVTRDMAGRQFILETNDIGSLAVGAPIYFHHIQVGQISSVSLNQDGRAITLIAFVNAPYDRFVTEDSRFWQASGIELAFDSGGMHLETESLATILAGGIAFASPTGSTASLPAPINTVFRLAHDQKDAMKAPDRVIESSILYFDESLRGLQAGSIVDFRGVEIGEVVAINVEYDRAQEKFHFPVLINVYPERIKSSYRESANLPHPDYRELLTHMIEHGFRAQLRPASLLTGQLYIALDFFPNAEKVKPQPGITPMPLPTIQGNIVQLQNTLISVAKKLDQLPLDKLSRDADDLLISANRTLENTNQLVAKFNSELAPEAKSTLTQMRSALKQTEHAIAPDSTLQNDLHTTLTSISRVADSVRILSEYLDRHPESLLRGKAEDKK